MVVASIERVHSADGSSDFRGRGRAVDVDYHSTRDIQRIPRGVGPAWTLIWGNMRVGETEVDGEHLNNLQVMNSKERRAARRKLLRDEEAAARRKEAKRYKRKVCDPIDYPLPVKSEQG